MTIKLPKVNGKYGAPMGRTYFNTNFENIPCKVYIKRVYTHEGYDNGGAYWGDGQPLFIAFFNHFFPEDNTEIEGQIFVRANGRNEAKQIVKNEWGFASFYR